MARWLKESWPVAPPETLMRFRAADWPTGDPAAAWKSARRRWCLLHGYIQPGPPHPDSAPEGPFGDVVDMLCAEREARLMLAAVAE